MQKLQQNTETYHGGGAASPRARTCPCRGVNHNAPPATLGDRICRKHRKRHQRGSTQEQKWYRRLVDEVLWSGSIEGVLQPWLGSARREDWLGRLTVLRPALPSVRYRQLEGPNLLRHHLGDALAPDVQPAARAGVAQNLKPDQAVTLPLHW